MDARKVILIPMDGSEFSHTIVKYVQSLFPAINVKLILLRIAAPVTGQLGLPPRQISSAWPLAAYTSAHDVELAQHPIYKNQQEQSARASYIRSLEAMAAELMRQGYWVACDVWFGMPAEAIITFAQTRRVDLIAMATHARGGLGQLVLGSVAEDVLRQCGVPVLLVHPHEDIASGRYENEEEALTTTPRHTAG